MLLWRAFGRRRCTDWEHWVVDDGGTDDGASLVEELAVTEPRLHLLRQPNGHICNARNNGFARCSPAAEYLLFLDHDDLLEPDFLEKMSAHLDTHSEVGVVYCGFTAIGPDDAPLAPEPWMEAQRYVPKPWGYGRVPPSLPETPFLSLISYHQAIPSSVLFRRSVYERAGGWDEETGRKVYEDKDLLLRCALLAPVHFLNRPLVQYRLHETNASWRDNPGWREHYEGRWLRGSFLSPAQKRLTRRGIAFDRFLAGAFALRDAGQTLRRGRLLPAAKDALKGAKRLATAPLAFLAR